MGSKVGQIYLCPWTYGLAGSPFEPKRTLTAQERACYKRALFFPIFQFEGISECVCYEPILSDAERCQFRWVRRGGRGQVVGIAAHRPHVYRGGLGLRPLKVRAHQPDCQSHRPKSLRLSQRACRGRFRPKPNPVAPHHSADTAHVGHGQSYNCTQRHAEGTRQTAQLSTFARSRQVA